MKGCVVRVGVCGEGGDGVKMVLGSMQYCVGGGGVSEGLCSDSVIGGICLLDGVVEECVVKGACIRTHAVKCRGVV